jgi:hypothetical protein
LDLGQVSGHHTMAHTNRSLHGLKLSIEKLEKEQHSHVELDDAAVLRLVQLGGLAGLDDHPHQNHSALTRTTQPPVTILIQAKEATTIVMSIRMLRPLILKVTTPRPLTLLVLRQLLIIGVARSVIFPASKSPCRERQMKQTWDASKNHSMRRTLDCLHNMSQLTRDLPSMLLRRAFTNSYVSCIVTHVWRFFFFP